MQRVDALPPRVRPAVQLSVRTVKDSFNDRAPGLAAEVAFYTILSLPPLLLTVVAALGLAGDVVGEQVRQPVLDAISEFGGAFLTPETEETLLDAVERIFRREAGGLLGVGFVLTIFSASRALRVLTVAITIAYDLEDTRPGWHQFLYGIGLTLAVMLVGIVFVPLFVAGPALGRQIASWAGLEAVFANVWEVAYWPVAALLATCLLATLYHVAAPWWTPWRRDYPGAVLAMVVALGGSLGLRIYTQLNLGADQSIFAGLGTVIVTMLWLYVVSLGVILGAELNAEIEKMWPTEVTRSPLDRLRGTDLYQRLRTDNEAVGDAADPGESEPEGEDADAATTGRLDRPDTGGEGSAATVDHRGRGS